MRIKKEYQNITNKQNLPEPIYNGICEVNTKYTKGDADFSATELLQPTQIVILKKQYGHLIKEDANDMIWRFFGHLLHNFLELQANEKHLTEERLFCEIAGKTISGQADLFDGTNLTDYKFTSIYAVKKEPKPEWIRQLNIYKYLYEKAGFTDIKGLKVCAVLRDWTLSKTVSSGYPDSQIKMINIPIKPKEEVENFIENRINEIVLAEKTGDIPKCTDIERWASRERFALMKKNNKKASKLFLTEKECLENVDRLNEKYNNVFYCEKRKGEQTKRCDNYCVVKDFCTQYKDLKGVK